MVGEQQPAAVPEVRVRRILFPTDFSPGAETAARWAEVMRHTFGAELVVLHVLDLSLAGLAGLSTQVAMMPAVDELVERVRAEAAEEMARLQARFPQARTVLREGSTRPTILQVAEELGADLIVMGTHGRTGLARVLLGSVAEYVVRHSRIPVLTIREAESA
jgi:nucleotide-binding universal stress UspA family protein